MLLSSGHFPSHSLACALRDYPRWHRGRERYAVWVLPVEDPPLLAHIRALRRQLADLLHPAGERQPHLTLFVCGFECEQRRHGDDFSPQQLQRQLHALQQLPRSPARLGIGAVDSFASAAFLSVTDPQRRLAQWRTALARGAREIRQAAYVPHITLGLYRRRVEAAALRQRLAQLPQMSFELPVERLIHASYQADRQHGPLLYRHTLTLGKGS